MSACSEYNTEDELFFVRATDADMPVWVRGNTASGVFILFLHGGPGGNALTAPTSPAFLELERDYAVVYWDQRASGTSQGNPDESTFTVDQFVADTSLVVDTLYHLHSPRALFIFGHSWGGALGAAYLSRDDNQSKVTGFICADSGHNLLEGLPKSVEWLADYSRRQISAGVRVSYWQSALDWFETKPDMTKPDNYFKYAEYLRVPDRPDAYWHQPDYEGKYGPDAAFIFASPLSLALFFNGQYLAKRFNILELNLSPDMARIQIPSLVLWGAHDGVNTLEMGQDAFSSLGTPEPSKRFFVFEESGHQPFVEESDLFVKEVRTFIEQNR